MLSTCAPRRRMCGCRVGSNFVVLLSFLTFLRQTVGVPSISKGSCLSSLGVENEKNTDIHLSASSISVLPINHVKYKSMKAEYGRLNNTFAWCTDQTHGSWLMVEFGHVITVTGLATQGFSNIYNDYYVEKYRVQYSLNDSDWKYIAKNGTVKTFTGNSNGFDAVRNDFDTVQAKCIRFVPVLYNYRVCMRVELYGCVNGTDLTTTFQPPTTAQLNHTIKSSSQTTAVTSTEFIESSTDPMPQNGSSNSSKMHKRSSSKKSIKSHKDSSRLNYGLLGVIIFAALAALIIISVLTFLILRRKKRKKSQQCQQYCLHDADFLQNDDKIPCIQSIESCENGNIMVL